LDGLTAEGLATVPCYTLRFFDDDGEPEETEEIDCASDAEAINAVNDRAETRSVELWLGERKILWWPARHPRPRRSHPRTGLSSDGDRR
jgi:hypothetical protein